jgi:hypothetical protein
LPAEEPEDVALSFLFCKTPTQAVPTDANWSDMGLVRMQNAAIDITAQLQNQLKVSESGEPRMFHNAHSLLNNHRTLLHCPCACENCPVFHPAITFTNKRAYAPPGNRNLFLNSFRQKLMVPSPSFRGRVTGK